MILQRVIFIVEIVVLFTFRSEGFRLPYLSRGPSKVSMCIDTNMKPIARSSDPTKKDSDTSWMTKPTSIIPVNTPNRFSFKPDIITFEAVGVFIEPSQSVGRWYREVLNARGDMSIRLPRPALFSTAFSKAYDEM